MNEKNLKKKFERMGARLKVGEFRPRPWERSAAQFRLDVKTDRHGEYFELMVREDADPDVRVTHLDAADRHLLLLAKEHRESFGREQTDLHRLLCGHDERHWFAANVPGAAASVARAKEALKPVLVRDAQARHQLKQKHKNRRKNAAFLRQGEWFFVPAPDLEVDPKLVLRKEPLQRGRGKPHLAEFVYRRGGQTVHVCRHHPYGVTESHLRALLQRDPGAKSYNWNVMRRDPEAFANGKIRHPDHKTLVLPDWHRVLPNTEAEAPGQQNLVFLD